MQTPKGRVWTVVLAGGEGERLRPLTTQWLGRHVPKQYCTFVGTRSMLEHTLDRAMHVSRPEQVVTVMARSHASLPIREHPALCQGRVVLQPDNRDTAPGVFLALTYVYAADPDATVVLFPSDHFVHPEELFMRQVREALLAAKGLECVVLLGVAPQSLELDYGWIQPGRALDDREAQCRARAIEMFVEKPPRAVAHAIRRSGALWNTMVVAGSVRSLWALGRRHLPEVIGRFETLAAAIGADEEMEALDRIYRDMPPCNFSAHLLQQSVEALAVVELRGVSWSDWGTADRIAATVQSLGKRPAFAVLNQSHQHRHRRRAGVREGAA